MSHAQQAGMQHPGGGHQSGHQHAGSRDGAAGKRAGDLKGEETGGGIVIAVSQGEVGDKHGKGGTGGSGMMGSRRTGAMGGGVTEVIERRGAGAMSGSNKTHLRSVAGGEGSSSRGRSRLRVLASSSKHQTPGSRAGRSVGLAALTAKGVRPAAMQGTGQAVPAGRGGRLKMGQGEGAATQLPLGGQAQHGNGPRLHNPRP